MHSHETILVESPEQGVPQALGVGLLQVLSWVFDGVLELQLVLSTHSDHPPFVHVGTEQLDVLVSPSGLSTQKAPPQAGAGLVQVLVAVFTPLTQALQSDQADHPP
jgi:hypothetical protein